MGSEEEQGASTTLKLPLLPLKSHVAHIQSPERSNTFASPIHSLASVPFSWEEEPGKPKHSIDSSSAQDFTKCLELPPRLLIERDAKSITKLPSPTTVLDGPYSMGRSRRFESSSFRMMVMGGECYGSFRSDFYSPDHDEMEVEKQQVGALILAGKREGHRGRLGFVGIWKKRALKGKGELGGGSYVFPSSGDRESEYSNKEEGTNGNTSSCKVTMTKITRTGSFSSIPTSRSHFWATVYEGLKQVVPWKSKKIRG